MTYYRFVAGVDEVGRGPLAGAVVAAAVILDPELKLPGIRDSKKLSHLQRLKLDPLIKDQALAWSIGRAEVWEIDQINILNATLLAMQRAVMALSVKPDYVVVDGNRVPALPYKSEALVKGDQKLDSIMAASIVAKVSRDLEMIEYDQQFPGYGFARNKGYGTRAHMAALRELGPCGIHRRSFSPVSEMNQSAIAASMD